MKSNMSKRADVVDTTADNDDHYQPHEKAKCWGRIRQLVNENFYSGVTVALVSIPLSSALAMAQGGTAMMGLTTAIYGPAIGAILGGSNYNILGPAGALVNIVSTLKNDNGVEIIPQLAIWSGVMSYVIYKFKLE